MNFQDLYKKIRSIDEGAPAMMDPNAVAQQQMSAMQAKMPNLDPATMMKNQQARMAQMKAQQPPRSSPGTWTQQGVPAASAAPAKPVETDWEESVEECGSSMPSSIGHSMPKQSDSVTMNVSMNGSGAGGIADLMNILKNIEAKGAPDLPNEPLFGDESYEEDFQNATTEPNEVTLDIDSVIPTGDDLHSKGREAEKVNGGGNPFNVDESLVSHLTQMYQEIKEGAEFGSYYYEKVAQEIFNKRQDITSEDEVLNQAYKIVSNDLGQKSARYKFNYDEDFPSDVVSAYSWLRKHQHGR